MRVGGADGAGGGRGADGWRGRAHVHRRTRGPKRATGWHMIPVMTKSPAAAATSRTAAHAAPLAAKGGCRRPHTSVPTHSSAGKPVTCGLRSWLSTTGPFKFYLLDSACVATQKAVYREHTRMHVCCVQTCVAIIGQEGTSSQCRFCCALDVFRARHSMPFTAPILDGTAGLFVA